MVFIVSSFAIEDHSPVNSAWCVLCGVLKLRSSLERNAKSHPISVQNEFFWTHFQAKTCCRNIGRGLKTLIANEPASPAERRREAGEAAAL